MLEITHDTGEFVNEIKTEMSDNTKLVKDRPYTGSTRNWQK